MSGNSNAQSSQATQTGWDWMSSSAGSDPVEQASPFQPRPLQVTWEISGPCEVKKGTSRNASRVARTHFSTAEAFHLIEQVATMQVPLLAMTGGDPLSRPDLFPVIEFAARRSLRTSLALPPTPALNEDVIQELKAAGLMRVAFWLHGSTPTLNEAYGGASGDYRRTLEIIGTCQEAQLPVQINTAITRRNLHDVDPMIELLTRLDVALWNLFFPVAASVEQPGEMLSAEEHEQIFAKLYKASARVNFHIKTTEGQHYQRYVLLERARESRSRPVEFDGNSRKPKNVNDCRGLIFIDHKGDAYPSRFLSLSAGNVMTQSLSDVYGSSSLFVSLRDCSRLKGKCGRCFARHVCGGSRARAYAMTGDLFAPDPACAYEP